MLIEILNKFNYFNENLFQGLDSYINGLGFFDWVSDAIIDTLHLLPILFFVFIIIELVEFFLAEKINTFLKKSEKASPIIGSFLAIFPQCGFSVIASTLYVRHFITKGTLLAIFLATSDEAIPILLARPDKIYFLIPLIITKLIVAIIFGLLIDIILKKDKYVFKEIEIEEPDGCCKHGVSRKRKRDLIYHPIIHTINITLFILIISLIINFIFEFSDLHHLAMKFAGIKFLMPIFTALFGLIPNCAISITLTMLLIKGSISFGATMAGLLSNAGLGILVLLKNNNKIQDSLKIIGILYLISVFAGMVLQFFKI